MSGPVERHEMPNGAVIFYRDSDHAYWTGYDERKGTCSGRTPGISTVAKNDGDTNSDTLIDWGVRLAYEGVAREASLGLSLEDADDIRQALAWQESAESIRATLLAEKLGWRDIRNAKGDVGTLTHGVLEALAQGVTPMPRTGYDHAAIAWWNARRPEVLDSERVTYSLQHGFAGRFDLRARITEDVSGPYALPDLAGKVALADAKTSGFISNSCHVQAEGYELANAENGIGESDARVILQLREDGTWREWESHATGADFLTALTAYRMGRRISNAARADWRAWKQAQEASAA